MPSPQTETRGTPWGVILQAMGVLLVAGGMMWSINSGFAKMGADQDALMAADIRHEVQLEAQTEAQGEINFAVDGRLRALEMAVSRADERLTSIYASVQRIERLLEGDTP